MAVDSAGRPDPHMEGSRRWSGWHPDWRYLEVKMKVVVQAEIVEATDSKGTGRQDALCSFHFWFPGLNDL